MRYGARFLLRVDCLSVQRCTAANLLRYASFSAVAAQCAGAVLGRYVIRCIPSCCVSVVQACRDALHAAKLLRCIFLSAVADAMRSVGARWKGSVLWKRKRYFTFFAKHNTLAATQRSAQRQRKAAHYVLAFSHLLLCKMKSSTIIKKIRIVPHYSQTPHQRGARSRERTA